jgi:hypothetical protein
MVAKAVEVPAAVSTAGTWVWGIAPSEAPPTSRRRIHSPAASSASENNTPMATRAVGPNRPCSIE